MTCVSSRYRYTGLCGEARQEGKELGSVGSVAVVAPHLISAAPSHQRFDTSEPILPLFFPVLPNARVHPASLESV